MWIVWHYLQYYLVVFLGSFAYLSNFYCYCRCQQLCQNYDDRLESLENELETQSDKFLKELEDVELWIQNAYSLLRQEPARAVEGIYTQDEMDAEEAEVMGQRSRDSSSSMGGGHQLGYAASGELFSSGEFGSLGSDGLIIGSLEEGKVHDTSVDPDLSDEEYKRQVLDRVISPEPDEVEGEGSSVDQAKEYEVGFSMSATEVSLAAVELCTCAIHVNKTCLFLVIWPSQFVYILVLIFALHFTICLPMQSDGEEEGDREGQGAGSDVDKAYDVQFAMSPEPPEQEEEPTTAEGLYI